MADLDKAAGELATKAALRRARDKAEKMLNDALLSEEELAKQKAEEEALAKRKRNKIIAIAIVGILLVLGVVGLVLTYWQWFLLVGLIGLAGLYGRYRWNKRRAAKKSARVKKEEAPPIKETPRLAARVERPIAPAPVVPPPVVEDTSIEDELAALKARVKK